MANYEKETNTKGRGSEKIRPGEVGRKRGGREKRKDTITVESGGITSNLFIFEIVHAMKKYNNDNC